ncbi:hypothetical protein COV61_03825 [Candidatus Micrarchaeota archaeon CG11_big_fil_rev_8_21_14_0_20_47_5]|nr:MAG: hypothetical protein AUJ17_04400 [Candidatus Micrarchaeota archaeon CG1_02_47_40]PIN83192.1 MAG: hypothetical protein COV61_03825 [Candidatus Micrarchaeota archaeon CG11_big_fil_rev_8_21_14_0_20_47_5]
MAKKIMLLIIVLSFAFVLGCAGNGEASGSGIANTITAESLNAATAQTENASNVIQVQAGSVGANANSREGKEAVISGVDEKMSFNARDTDRLIVSGMNNYVQIYNCEDLKELVLSGMDNKVYYDSVCEFNVIKTGVRNELGVK